MEFCSVLVPKGREAITFDQSFFVIYLIKALALGNFIGNFTGRGCQQRRRLICASIPSRATVKLQCSLDVFHVQF